MDCQRESFDANTEKLMENLVKISQIQQNIGKLNAENITLVSLDNTFRLHGRLALNLDAPGQDCRRPSSLNTGTVRAQGASHIPSAIL